MTRCGHKWLLLASKNQEQRKQQRMNAETNDEYSKNNKNNYFAPKNEAKRKP